MRIAHIISSPSGIGGAERILLDLVGAGDEQGWVQRVLNPFSASSAIEDMCPPGTYTSYPALRVGDLAAARTWVRRELSDFRPEIVHVHLFHALVLMASLRRPATTRLVLTHHHGSRYVAESQHLHEWADRLCGRRYDVIVAVSESTRRMLSDRYRYPESKLRTIPNGWSGNPLSRDRTSGRRVVCVANFRAQKGHDVLLSAFAQVVRRVPDASLVLVGDGTLRGALVAQARSLGVQDAVQFEGAVDDVWPLLAEADVFALASRYEPLGLAALEAMAAGLPVIATKVDGLRMLVEPGVNGELVPPDDPDKLAAELVRLLESPGLAARMGDAGRLRAAEHGARRMTEQYASLYEELASE